MATITRFEDLRCWQKARELVNAVYTLTGKGELARDFELRDQLRRAAISAMTNISEGFARYHKKDFMRFLDISQSSAAEVKSLMYVVLDQRYAPPAEVTKVQDLAVETRELTLGLLRYVKRTLNQKPKGVREPTPVYTTTSNNNTPWDLREDFIHFEDKPNPTQTLKHPNT